MAAFLVTNSIHSIIELPSKPTLGSPHLLFYLFLNKKNLPDVLNFSHIMRSVSIFTGFHTFLSGERDGELLLTGAPDSNPALQHELIHGLELFQSTKLMLGWSSG